MRSSLIFVAIAGASALHMQKTQTSLDASRCSCTWASSAACAPEKDDGSDCMTVCCSTFMQAMGGGGGGLAAPSMPTVPAAAPAPPPPPPKEERLHCDCSWVLQGGCSNGGGDGSPCSVKCCAAPPEFIKGAFDDFVGDIKDKLGGGTPAPGSAIKVEIPVWR